MDSLESAHQGGVVDDRDQQVMLNQLSGCTEHWSMDKTMIDMAITALVHCVPHGGVHHFAVTDEGTTLHFSTSGLDCLRRLALFRTLFQDATVSP